MLSVLYFLGICISTLLLFTLCAAAVVAATIYITKEPKMISKRDRRTGAYFVLSIYAWTIAIALIGAWVAS